MAEKAANLNKTRALWQLTRGQRLRYVAAAVSLTIGIGFLYLSPLIVRATIDGLIGRQPVGGSEQRFVQFLLGVGGNNLTRALLLAGLCLIGVTALSALFTYLNGQWAAYPSEQIARPLPHLFVDPLH